MSSPVAVSAPPLKPYQVILVVILASIGFLFDTYELLMFPLIGANAVKDLLHLPSVQDPEVAKWAGRMLWIAALCGGVFGLLGGWLIDRLGRKTIMVASILLYSLSPVAAAFSTELWMLILFRCTTFIGVCVELVAAVTWLAELFADKRTREKVIAWTLAMASLGGIMVTEVYKLIVAHAGDLPGMSVGGEPDVHAAWRYTLLTGLVPGLMILLLLPFVPESRVWAEKKRAGTLKRPSFRELFGPGLLKTTLATTVLSACGYAAAFGALQMTPIQIAPGLPDIAAKRAALDAEEKEATTPALKAELGKKKKAFADEVQDRRGDIQRWQEIGGLTGRILLAILLMFVPSRTLIRLFLIPGIALFPLTYLELVKGEYFLFAVAIFFCGLLTVAQFSYLSEFLPKVFPIHLRGTGGSFATNVGGRMIGTMAATLNTEVLSGLVPGATLPMKIATGAAIIGGSVYLIALVASFFLPDPKAEE